MTSVKPCAMSEAQVRALARRLPKAQIHLHLDGSLPGRFLEKHSLPSREEFLREKFGLISRNAYKQGKGGNWPGFTVCNSVLQTGDALQEATRDVLSEVLGANCRVIELRFCPTLHTKQSLSEDEAVEAVVCAFGDMTVDKFVRGGIILCALRSFDEKHVLNIAQLAKRWLGKGVIGMDLAGDEVSYPLRLYGDVLAKVGREIPLTIHAGENGKEGAENVELAVEIGARRIGHGLVLGEDEALCEKVREGGVYVETCLTGNCTGGGKVEMDRFDLHPIGKMLEKGVQVAGFNCDNLLLSGTLKHRADPTEEIVRAKVHCGLTWGQIRQVLLNGARASFDGMGGTERVEMFVRGFEEQLDALLGHVIVEEEKGAD